MRGVVVAEEPLFGDPEWVVVRRTLSPKQHAGEVDCYWGGPEDPCCPSTWHGRTPAKAARFPSADAALAALEAVFGAGTTRDLPYSIGPVRVIPAG